MERLWNVGLLTIQSSYKVEGADCLLFLSLQAVDAHFPDVPVSQRDSPRPSPGEESQH